MPPLWDKVIIKGELTSAAMTGADGAASQSRIAQEILIPALEILKGMVQQARAGCLFRAGVCDCE